ncbi:MAG: adenylate/guanylate cyclase domain-containing protein [Methyloceanibacter sp.]|nr:adenylate/guanylate cyclase domain-containing protein [Methyloceanibacter sp.]
MNSSDEINAWLMNEGRLMGEPLAIIDAYAQCMRRAGVPLARANISQILANPLLIAWGVIWQPEGTTRYEVPHLMLDSPAYIGSPFEYVLTHEEPLHKSLRDLDPNTEHASYLELAENGGTDLFANVLEYGDGSRQGCTYLTHAVAGFRAEDIALIHGTRHGLAAALEPVAMRSSTDSLLRTYLGNGPATAVIDGTITRGQHTEIDAVVMFVDMRGFTRMSDSLVATHFLNVLNRYFDLFVNAIGAHGGDVLKLLGDGVLAIFTVDGRDGATANRHAINAAFAALDELEVWNQERIAEELPPISVGIGLHRGKVTYGNIGSPDRLDFTAVGSAVNIASRLQDLCKRLKEPLLLTSTVASAQGYSFDDVGEHALLGIADPVKVLKPRRSLVHP